MLARSFLVTSLLCLAGFCASAIAGEAGGARFLGHVDIARDAGADGVALGGLSGLTWLGGDRYLAISDRIDRPRAYVLNIALEADRLAPEGVKVEAVMPLRTASGLPLTTAIDAEGVARAADGRILVADEGNTSKGKPSRLLWFDAELRTIGAIDPPAKTLPVARERTPDRYGIRRNLGFESLAITADGHWIVTASEQAMVQDGPIAAREVGSPARIFTFEADTGAAGPEYVYEVEPFPAFTDGRTTIEKTGLSELLALETPGVFLALERSFTLLGGFTTRLYRIDLSRATDVSRHDALPARYRPVEKVEVLDLRDIGAPSENYEGMAMGPRLGDGRQVIYLISDDNLNALQKTRLVAVALDLSQERFARIPSGAAHGQSAPE